MGKNKGNNKWKWISVILSSPYTWVGVSTVITVIWTALKGWLESPYAPLLVPIFVLVIGLTFFSVNQITIWKRWHRKGFASQTNEQIEDTLRKWLDKKQYSLTHKPNDNDLFCFVAMDKQGRPINIMRPKKEPQSIRLLLVVSEDQIKEMSNPQQNIIRHAIGVEMARLGVLWSPSPMCVYLDLPCDDSLTESVLISTLNKIRQSSVLVSAIGNYLIVEFNESSKKQDSDKEDSQPESV